MLAFDVADYVYRQWVIPVGFGLFVFGPLFVLCLKLYEKYWPDPPADEDRDDDDES